MRVIHYVWIIWLIIIVLVFARFGWTITSIMLMITGVAFLQNMSFTWVSRSRNSGNPEKHRYAAWGSNGIWMMTQVFIAANVYTPISNMMNGKSIDMDSIYQILATFLIYALATTEGSVFMMKVMLGKLNIPILSKFLLEKDINKVGAR